MKMKTESKIIISVFITLVILSVGCITPIKGIQTRQKCDQDTECAGAFCSENFREVVIPTCVEGRCQDIATECADSEICVADSLGVRCLPKDPITNKAILSCANNTINPGLLPFNPEGYVCGDDCPEDSFCNPDCICVLKETLSCSENTDDFLDFGLSLFDQKTNMCMDDCPLGFDCIVGCVCEEYNCPDPVFTDNYFDPPPIDASYDDLMLTWLEDPDSLFSWIGDTINISAYQHVRDGVIYYIPFPEEQLTLIPNPKNKLIHEEGWEGYCVNDYYDGDEAMDIDYQWLSRPIQGCVWGGTAGFEGVLTVCTEIMIDWFEAYTQ